MSCLLLKLITTELCEVVHQKIKRPLCHKGVEPLRNTSISHISITFLPNRTSSASYYANILNPFSPLVAKKINDIVALNLPINMICPSHGIFWRSNPLQIVENYAKWATAYKENQITIIYDTMWDGTRRMEEEIAVGIRAVDPDVIVKLYNSSRTDKNDIITEVFKSKAILVSCPTVNKGILSSLAGLMEEIKGLAFKEKKAAAFGTYGWSGEGPKVLARLLREAGFAVMDSELKGLWSPDEKACHEFGRQFSEFSK